jgi:predicted DNA-binding transcriptional regulator AlpA
MRILRIEETERKTGYANRRLRELERAGLFPKRFMLNPAGNGRAVGHLESEVDDWIASCAAARDAS